MTALILDPTFSDADAVYTKILKAHEGLSDADSAAMNARLVLLLANHIGRVDVLDDALKLARDPTATLTG